MQFPLRDIVVLFSGFLGLVLATYLFRYPGGNRRAGQLLASFLMLQAVLLIVSVFLFRHFLFMEMERTFRYLFYFESSLLFLDGLLLYAYCSTLLLNRCWHWRRVLKHVGVGLVPIAASLYLYNHEDVMSYFNPVAPHRSAKVGFAYSMMQAVRASYGALCLGLLYQYRSRMVDQFSNLAKPDVVWLFGLIKGFSAYRICWLLFHLYFTTAALFAWHMLDYKWFIGGGLLLLDVCWLGVSVGLLYFGLKFSPKFLSLNDPAVHAATKAFEVDANLVQKLERALTERRLYANPELRLDDLAKALGQSARTLSALINQHYQTNFCDFINRYRIAEAKRQLKSEGKVNVMDLSLEVGFNSKSAFNRAFKKDTGLTPGEYRRA